MGWDGPITSLVLIIPAVGQGKRLPLEQTGTKFLHVLINILLCFLETGQLFPMWSKQKDHSEDFDTFSGLWNSEDFILHKTVFFIYLKLVCFFS